MFNFDELKEEKNLEPTPDIAICESCKWTGNVNECLTEQEGDWESGYYNIDICPKCNEAISDYDMTPETLKKWEEWIKKN